MYMSKEGKLFHMNLERTGFSTRAIHAGETEKDRGSITTPIYQTSPFEFKSVQHGARIMSGEKKGYVYSRGLNPTTEVLEEKIANLEGGEAALAQTTGMAAISTAILTSVSSGDHIIADEVLYGSTYGLFVDLSKFGIDVSFIDTSEIQNVEEAFRPETKLVFLETPANPTNKITDIERVSKITHERGAKVFVDNTYMTPYFQQPLKLGADVVLHSATKYLNGHGDTLGGIIVGPSEFITSARHTVKNFGGAISPFSSWLIIRGIKTLGVRMDRHNENAMSVARFLSGHKKIDRVIYPGLKDHPGHKIARKQMSGYGGMIAVILKRAKDVPVFLDNLKLCTLAVSLGETGTLIQHPASMTHGLMPRAKKIESGIVDELVRLSTGIENVNDIIDDLDQALENI